MALPSPSPFSLPLLLLTYITRQQRASWPVSQRLGWGRMQCDPLLLEESIPKIHTVGRSVLPAQNTYGGATSLPYATTSLTLRSTKPNYGQLNPKGPRGGCFLHTPFWAHGQVSPNPKELGGCNFGKTHFGQLGVTCPFFCFGLLSISGPPGPRYRYRYPTYRP